MYICVHFSKCSWEQIYYSEVHHQGARVAQLVKHRTLDFGSDHGLGIVRVSLTLGSVPGVESA